MRKNYSETEELLGKRFKGAVSDIKDPGRVNVTVRETRIRESFFQKPAIQIAALVLVAALVGIGTFGTLKYLERISGVGTPQPTDRVTEPLSTGPEETPGPDLNDPETPDLAVKVTCGAETINPEAYAAYGGGVDGDPAYMSERVPYITYVNDGLKVDYDKKSVSNVSYGIAGRKKDRTLIEKKSRTLDEINDYLKDAAEDEYRIVIRIERETHDGYGNTIKSVYDYPFDVIVPAPAESADPADTTDKTVIDTDGAQIYFSVITEKNGVIKMPCYMDYIIVPEDPEDTRIPDRVYPERDYPMPSVSVGYSEDFTIEFGELLSVIYIMPSARNAAISKEVTSAGEFTEFLKEKSAYYDSFYISPVFDVRGRHESTGDKEVILRYCFDFMFYFKDEETTAYGTEDPDDPLPEETTELTPPPQEWYFDDPLIGISLSGKYVDMPYVTRTLLSTFETRELYEDHVIETNGSDVKIELNCGAEIYAIVSFRSAPDTVTEDLDVLNSLINDPPEDNGYGHVILTVNNGVLRDTYEFNVKYTEKYTDPVHTQGSLIKVKYSTDPTPDDVPYTARTNLSTLETGFIENDVILVYHPGMALTAVEGASVTSIRYQIMTVAAVYDPSNVFEFDTLEELNEFIERQAGPAMINISAENGEVSDLYSFQLDFDTFDTGQPEQGPMWLAVACGRDFVYPHRYSPWGEEFYNGGLVAYDGYIPDETKLQVAYVEYTGAFEFDYTKDEKISLSNVYLIAGDELISGEERIRSFLETAPTGVYRTTFRFIKTGEEKDGQTERWCYEYYADIIVGYN